MYSVPQTHLQLLIQRTLDELERRNMKSKVRAVVHKTIVVAAPDDERELVEHILEQIYAEQYDYN